MSSYIRTMPPWPLNTPLPAGALSFFYDPGTDKEYRLDPARLAGSDEVSSLYYPVIYLSAAEAAAVGEPQFSSLDRVPAAKLCLNATAYVDRNADHHWLLRFDGRPPGAVGQLRVFLDYQCVPLPGPTGSVDGLVPARWVKADSAAAGVEAYAQFPTGYSFATDELVRDYAGDTIERFFARLAPGGPAPAPSAPGGDANWRVVAESSVPTPGGAGLPPRNIYAVPAARRQAVVDANSPAVLESNTAYYGCEFVDEVNDPSTPAWYRCMASAQADGSTAWKWFRFAIL